MGRGMWTLGERKPTICRPHLHLYIRHTALLMVFDKKHLPNSQRRFLKHFADYLDGIVRENELRDENCIVDVDQCTVLRREFSGTQTTFALFEYAHVFDLPDAVFDNQNFMAMYWAAVDMVNFANVSFSNS